jgi:DNA-binding transcriptional LysR family regulator
MVGLPGLSTFLAKEAPGASVRVLTIPDDPGAGLSSGEVDFAMGFFDNLTSGFLQSFLNPEHFVCIVRAGHPRFRAGMSLEAFVEAKQAIADATGMAHAGTPDVLPNVSHGSS